LKIYEDISSYRAGRDAVVLVDLDIQGAYDSIWHDALVYKCLEIGFSHRLCRWIAYFLSVRVIKVKWRDTFSASLPNRVGLLQGSVLSPILFSIFMADIQEIFNHNVGWVLYADDIFIYAKGSNYQIARKLLQNTLEDLLKWCTH